MATEGYENHMEIFKFIVNGKSKYKNQFKDIFDIIYDYVHPDRKELYECAKNITKAYFDIFKIKLDKILYDKYVNIIYKYFLNSIGADYHKMFSCFVHDRSKGYVTNLKSFDYQNYHWYSWKMNAAEMIYSKIGTIKDDFFSIRHSKEFEKFQQNIFKNVLIFYNKVLAKRGLIKQFHIHWHTPYSHKRKMDNSKSLEIFLKRISRSEKDFRQLKKLMSLIVNRAIYASLAKPPKNIKFPDMKHINHDYVYANWIGYVY